MSDQTPPTLAELLARSSAWRELREELDRQARGEEPRLDRWSLLDLLDKVEDGH